MVSFSHKCRTCGENNNNWAEAVSVFSSLTEKNSPFVADILNMCCGLCVLQDDLCPKFICPKCMVSVKQVYRFREQCQKVDFFFKLQIEQNKITEEHENEAEDEDEVEAAEYENFTKSPIMLSETDTHLNESYEPQILHENDPVTNIVYDDEKSVEVSKEYLIHSSENQSQNIFACSICSFTTNDVYTIECHSKNHELLELNVERTQSSGSAMDQEIEDETYKSKSPDLTIEDENNVSQNIKAICKSNFFNTIKRFEKSIQGAQLDIEIRYKCSLCRDIFENGTMLLEHIETHSTMEQKICTKDFYDANRKRIKYQIQKHKPELIEVKENKFRNRSTTIVPGHRFECRMCFINFENKTKLYSHIHTKHPDKLEQRKCKKLFYNVNRISSGYNIGYVRKKIKERYLQALETDISTKVESEKKERKRMIAICDICGKTFSSKFHLADHMNIHTKEKQYECNICGKSFSQYSTLKQHIPLHTGNSRYLCSVCAKPCLTPGSLKIHETSHSDEKPFVCHLCGIAYRYKHNLVSHERKAHSGYRSKCNICNETFKSKEVLRRHMYIHNGYPFVCSLCPKRYIGKKMLQDHIANEHGLHVNIAVIQKGIPVKLDSVTSLK